MFDLMDLKVNRLADLPEVASQLLSAFPDQRIFFFFGQMGAGKTTFIQSICNRLSVLDSVSSPTYSIVNEYQSPAGRVYHFDFFRLKDESEALDMGYEEYFYGGDYCLVEWPEKIESLWPAEYVRVDMTVTDDEKRVITAGAIKSKG